jgi:hypothetical protein
VDINASSKLRTNDLSVWGGAKTFRALEEKTTGLSENVARNVARKEEGKRSCNTLVEESEEK